MKKLLLSLLLLSSVVGAQEREKPLNPRIDSLTNYTKVERDEYSTPDYSQTYVPVVASKPTYQKTPTPPSTHQSSRSLDYYGNNDLNDYGSSSSIDSSYSSGGSDSYSGGGGDSSW